jgi:ribosomal protein L4
MADKVINKEAKQGESELVSKVVRVILSNKRRATSKTKKRDDVSGGGTVKKGRVGHVPDPPVHPYGGVAV